MAGSLGSGQVEYHPDRPIFHFGTPQEEVANKLLTHKLRQVDFEIAERLEQ